MRHAQDTSKYSDNSGFRRILHKAMSSVNVLQDTGDQKNTAVRFATNNRSNNRGIAITKCKKVVKKKRKRRRKRRLPQMPPYNYCNQTVICCNCQQYMPNSHIILPTGIDTLPLTNFKMCLVGGSNETNHQPAVKSLVR